MAQPAEPTPIDGLLLGPTPMQEAHANGLRKATAQLKAHLTDEDTVESVLRVAVLTYLLEWQEVYARGAREAPGTTDRVIIQIRQDTVAQITAELDKGIPG